MFAIKTVITGCPIYNAAKRNRCHFLILASILMRFSLFCLKFNRIFSIKVWLRKIFRKMVKNSFSWKKPPEQNFNLKIFNFFRVFLESFVLENVGNIISNRSCEFQIFLPTWWSCRGT